MSRRIAPTDSLESLKREAKRWLRALRDDVDDARARLANALPNVSTTPTLRTIQHALARELGFPGWTALKEHFAGVGPPDAVTDELVARFLDNACPDHHVRGGPDHVRARGTALRLLARYPEIAHASFYTKVVCGDLAGVRRDLDQRPELARLRDVPEGTRRSGAGRSRDLLLKDWGPKGWTPLLYLCFTRLPLATVDENAVAIARALLDNGADPNEYFMAGDSRYTPLVGAIGEGEEDRPPHSRRDELVRLLMDHGAEFASSPGNYNGQVVYNIHFHGNVLWYLKLMHEYSLRRGRAADWDDPEWMMLAQGGYGSGARWHLWIAEKNDDLELAAWCLSHGANPNAAPAAAKTLPQGTLYEEAVRRGQTEMAELLVRYGAPRTEVRLSPVEALVAAAMRLDREAVRAQLDRAPELRRAPEPLAAAATRNRADVAVLLLDLGVSPDVENKEKERALHHAAYANSLDVARLLIARGAEIDPVESNWSNTPLGAAVYSQHQEMIDLLSRYSRDVWELTYAGKTERLRELLAEDPDRARAPGGGHTPLMWLPPDDESRATAIATLLIANGADPSPANEDGMTAADRAERLGMFELAAMLRRASTPPARSAVERWHRMAANLLDAYRTGAPEAMERHWADTWHRRSWEAMRRYVQLDLGRPPVVEGADVPITLDDARWLIARDNGFTTWIGLIEYTIDHAADSHPKAAAPFHVLSKPNEELPPPLERTRDWDVAIATVKSRGLPGLDANGQMTDDVLERVSRLEHVTVLKLGGSKQLTDAGVAHLARMSELRELDLGGCPITDHAMEVISKLPNLEKVGLWRTAVTDAGAKQLAKNERLERVDLAWTPTGDGALRALAGKETLTHFRSGDHVTDEGIRALHEYPVFKTWQDGEVVLGLTSADAAPNMLFLRGTFTDRGLASLAGLDGLFGLNVDDSHLAITSAGLEPLVSLPNLGFLAFDAKDDSMSYIARMPRLRFLMCQDTDAGDDGFVALSRSRSIEYIWGRRCHNLRSRGFSALADIPTLRSLSVSCKNVDDAGLSALPRFPALRELMPMDVPDDGYRHIGRCTELESLVLMYCRDTGDTATSHITNLPHLKKYFASYTRATDLTPRYLSEIESLESIDLAAIPGITNVGVGALTRLPKLRELHLGGMQNVDLTALPAFREGVKIDARG
ncbi:MAG TPA: ankyrin repeat domain-containing protein [Gemmatimonadaceae bacterium]|nr:ankyrin repeat domain-containing protein [Gemmatimonadaceae bacterium]